MSKTYGEQFTEALACKTKEEASAYLEEEILCTMNMSGRTHDEAKEMVLSNLGYMAGYYDHETAQKINRLFGAVHPVFGSAHYHKTLEEAFEAGIRHGKKLAEDTK